MHSTQLIPLVLASAVSARFLADSDLYGRDIEASILQARDAEPRGPSVKVSGNVKANVNLGPPPQCGAGVRPPCMNGGKLVMHTKAKRSVEDSLYARDAKLDLDDELEGLHARGYTSPEAQKALAAKYAKKWKTNAQASYGSLHKRDAESEWDEDSTRLMFPRGGAMVTDAEAAAKEKELMAIYVKMWRSKAKAPRSGLHRRSEVSSLQARDA